MQLSCKGMLNTQIKQTIKEIFRQSENRHSVFPISNTIHSIPLIHKYKKLISPQTKIHFQLMKNNVFKINLTLFK